MNINRYMNYAKNTAELSQFHRQQIGCVVVYKKHIIGVGVNSYKTHPLQKEYNKYRYSEDNTPHSLHAEIAALAPLRGMDIEWKRVSLFLVRLKKSPKSTGSARPCKACMEYIRDLGIENIYYSFHDDYVHEVLDLDKE